jgi:hypothetical protein
VVDAQVLAVGRHKLDRTDAVRREPVAATEPSDAAGERVAGDADVARGAVEHREARLARRIGDQAPQCARLRPHDPLPGVELEAVELPHLPSKLHRRSFALGPREVATVIARSVLGLTPDLRARPG